MEEVSAGATIMYPAWRQADVGSLDKAFNTVATAPNMRTMQDLNALFRPVLHELGFSLFAALRLANPHGVVHVRALFGDGFEAWLAHYLEMGYAPDDYILMECFRASEPFCWSDIARRGGLPESALRILQNAQGFGLCDGLAAPVRKSDGSILVVLFAGQRFNAQNQHAVTAAHLLASSYAIAGSHLYSTGTATAPKERGLTVRQIECLKWVRSGKTSAEIAQIVCISRRVVDEHIFNACRFLGVRTRAQAVHAASSLGYLDK